MNSSSENRVRQYVPQFVPRFLGWAFERLDPFVLFSYSQDGEDMVLRRLLERQPVGFYVDVGAHHPFRFSNTCFFHRRGWRGINIDPNPEAIAAFRTARPSDINLCVGVSDTPGEMSYCFFNDPALNTFDAKLAAQRALLPNYRLQETRNVAVRRLDDLLGSHLPQGQRIDFMSIDVEGLDLAVLRSNDWIRFRPVFLLVEAHERTVAAAESAPIHGFVVDQGYRIIAKTLNTLIYEDSSTAAVDREAG